MSDLGDLLERIHGARAPFAQLRVCYRTWRDEERLMQAFRAVAQRQGATQFAMYGAGGSLVESEQIIRSWRAGDRARVEREGGAENGQYGVRVGDRWWLWDRRSGAMSNEGDLTVGSGIGDELAALLDPTLALGALVLHQLGRGERAGRSVLRVQATPRTAHDSGRHLSFMLHDLGSGADRYELEFDTEHGVILGATAARKGEPFLRIEALEIQFDEPVDDAVFVFQAPEGEELRSSRDRFRHRHVGPGEAQRLASFTVLVPARVSADWRLRCSYLQPCERPPRRASVSLHYRSDSGHENVDIGQSPAGDADSAGDHLGDAGSWDEAVSDGITMRVRSLGGQAQLLCERDGTSVLMTSETLGVQQLQDLAATLVPVPSPGVHPPAS